MRQDLSSDNAQKLTHAFTRLAITTRQANAEIAAVGASMAKLRRFDVTPVRLTALILAVLIFGSAVGGVVLEQTDLRTFHDSAKAVLSGTDWYTPNESRRPNLNPPTFVLLTAPLGWLSLPVAFGLWTGLGLLSLVASLRVIDARLHLSPVQWFWIALTVIGFMPFTFVWVEGQVTFLLLYPLTRAWLVSSPFRSGLWMAMPIAIKPPLALMAICLPWPVWMASGVGAAAISGMSLAVAGWQPWQRWLEVSTSISWIGWPMNLSLFGLSARWQSGDVRGLTMADLSGVALVSCLIVLASMWISTVGADTDQRWTLALLWSVMVSPAGWIYYLPLALGPALASWRRSPWLLAGLILLAVPMPLLSFTAMFMKSAITGSVYAVGGLLVFVAVSRRS